jgi:hypothetical protein
VFTKPTAPRGIGGTLDDSIRLFRTGFAKSWPLALGAQLLVGIPTFYFRVKLGAAGQNPQQLLAMYLSASFWLPYLVCGIAAIGLYNAVTLQLSSEFQGTPESTRESMVRGYRLLGRVLLMFLVFGVFWAAIALVAAIAGGLIFATGAQISPLLRVAIILLLTPVVVYLMGRLFLTNVALLADDLRVFASVRTSWNLTNGNWWRGATVYGVMLLIAIVFYVIIGSVAGVITYSFGAASVAGAGLTELVSLVGATLILPLISATLVAIYYDFKLRIEGADLAGRVNALPPR